MMLKKSFVTILILSTAVIGIGSTRVSAVTSYPDALNGEAPVDVEITPPSNPIIPPVDPTNPDPDPDPDPNTKEGLLMLRYVSSLNFGASEFDGSNSQILFASDDINSNSGGSFPNMVTVQDIRGTRDGWVLTVKESAPLFAGAEITMAQQIHTPTADALGVTIPNGITIGSNAVEFARADNQDDGKAGVISIGMGQTELHIPAATGVGTYSSTLNWELVAGPTAP